MRIAGEERIGTAAAVARDGFDTAETVIVARSDDYPDALAGAPLATTLDAPLLLTHSDELSEVTAAVIDELGATDAVLLGGTAALAPAVEQALEEAGVTPRRVAGPDRFATAQAIAGEIGATDEVIVAQGYDENPDRGWPDALAAAPLAAAEKKPILLTYTNDLPQATSDALAASGATRVLLAGGPAAVSPAVETELAQDAVVDRIAGADRYETSVELQREAVARGLSAETVWLATGLDWPDSLSAGPAIARAGQTLLLADGTSLDASATSRDRLEELSGTTTALKVVGGVAAVADAVGDAAAALIE